jgi:hypothetical protein
MAFRQDMEARRLARLGAEIRGLIEAHGGLHTRVALVDALGCSDRDGLGILMGWWDEFRIADLLRYINILRCRKS